MRNCDVPNGNMMGGSYGAHLEAVTVTAWIGLSLGQKQNHTVANVFADNCEYSTLKDDDEDVDNIANGLLYFISVQKSPQK
jgi:hypothetical protein